MSSELSHMERERELDKSSNTGISAKRLNYKSYCPQVKYRSTIQLIVVLGKPLTPTIWGQYLPFYTGLLVRITIQ